MNRLKISLFIIGMIVTTWSCNENNVIADTSTTSQSAEALTMAVAETSGQLASGTSFNLDSGNRPHHGPRRKHPGILDGLNLIAPTDELLAIVDAESASDVRGLRLSKNGGATITNYDGDGNEVTVEMPATDGPQGCSFSGHQFPESDSLLATIVRTEINFGSGVTYRRDTIEITRTGKITIERTIDRTTITETTTFENYTVNGTRIEGTKTRVSTFDAETDSGSSTTSVADGKITFPDGTTATWTSDRSRVSDIAAGKITTEVNTSVEANGTVVSGVVEVLYRENSISIDFGDGSCTNRTVTINVNGKVTTKTIGD
jgi:hypothetical protein